MSNRKDKIFILRIAAFILIIIITAGLNNRDRLSAKTKTDKIAVTDEKTPVAEKKNPTDEKNDALTTSIEVKPVIKDQDTAGAEVEKSATDKKSDASKSPMGITPENTDKNDPGIKNEDSTPDKKVEPHIKAEDIFDYPETILNAYKEAYPDLITDVYRGESDWIVKFANGHIYYWAGGKILPESELTKSDKYITYSISPYNMNGRSPESYTEEKIEKLRVKKHPVKKRKIVPGVEGGFYRELFAITTKKSAKKQLDEVKLSGHYITVNHKLTEKIRLIDSKIKQLAKTDSEVRSFLKNIGSVEAFSWRTIAGAERMSNHSYGIAIDILPKKYHKKTIYWSWEQEKNRDWMLIPQNSLWTPPDPVVKIFREEGFIWGGHWDRYDTMHFEYRPELISLFPKIKFD